MTVTGLPHSPVLRQSSRKLHVTIGASRNWECASRVPISGTFARPRSPSHWLSRWTILCLFELHAISNSSRDLALLSRLYALTRLLARTEEAKAAIHAKCRQGVTLYDVLETLESAVLLTWR